jgi:hypothetical protein
MPFATWATGTLRGRSSSRSEEPAPGPGCLLYLGAMSPEAPLEPTEHGLLPAAEGWFVLNTTDAPWQDWAGRMQQIAKQGQADLSQLGVGLYVLSPGQPMSMYHRRRPTPRSPTRAGPRPC